MATNCEKLQRTLAHVSSIWSAEQRRQRRYPTNESAWTVQVVEPVLVALGWPRLRQGDLAGTGAYYEWPLKNKVDVVLLDRGSPTAFLELKQRHTGPTSCRSDLARKLAEHSRLRAARYAVAGWYNGEAGFCLYDVVGPTGLRPHAPVTLEGATASPKVLAPLAAPVLQNRVPSQGAWLASVAADAGAVRPRFSPRAVQEKFFAIVEQRLGVATPLVPRRAYHDHDLPSPTFAFVSLPGVLPADWGLVFDIDPTVNNLQCFFYRGGARKEKRDVAMSFDGGYSDEVLEHFVDRYTLPFIADWRREAIASGLV